jgi:hypothetical protein
MFGFVQASCTATTLPYLCFGVPEPTFCTSGVQVMLAVYMVLLTAEMMRTPTQK